MRKPSIIWFLLLFVGLFSSCKSPYLNVRGVAYQSIRQAQPQDQSKTLQNAKVIVVSSVDKHGNVEVIVKNNTDNIMTIDRTKSFFRGKSGNSIPYYDPTINVMAQSTTTGHTTGVNVNVGAVAGALGISGSVGTLLNGVNVGSSNQNSTTNTNTTYYVDQPVVSVAPHARTSMGRVFQEQYFSIEALGEFIQLRNNDINRNYTPENTIASCSIIISYSLDDGKTFDRIETELYTGSLIVSHVKQKGHVNDALRSVYMAKSDLFDEGWYMLCFGGDPWIDDGIYTRGLGDKMPYVVKDSLLNAWMTNYSTFTNYK